MRLALVGLGHVARAQLQALALLDGWVLAGAADVDAERRRLLSPEVPFFESVDALLAEVDADLVLVSTPTPTHYAIGMQVLASGRNLLLEKPCCGSGAEFEALQGLAAERGCFLHVALHSLHARDLRWFLARRSDFPPGVPDSIHCRFFDPYCSGGRLRPAARALGGSWQDSGINALAVVATLADTDSLQLRRPRFGEPADGCHDLRANVEFASRDGRSVVTIDTSWVEGVDSKTTTLAWTAASTEVLLDHSRERVRAVRDGVAEAWVELAGEQPRLVNHYIGVFDDARDALSRGCSNIAFARAIHELLFAAAREGKREARGTPWH